MPGGDGVEVVDIDILVVIGLEADLRNICRQGGHILGGAGVQIGLHQKAVLLKIVDGGAVGQDDRGVDGGQVDIGGKGGVGPAGGHSKAAALGDEIVQSFYIPGADPQVQSV